MVYIYVLQLEQGKYYVGKTTNPEFRLESHFKSNGSEFTKKYKPIKILELIQDCDDYDEDKYTRMYMDKYGIDNVRGGSYVSVKLDEATKNQLTKMSNSTLNKCFKCGEAGHFANRCYVNENSDDEEEDIWCCEYCDKEFRNESKCMLHELKCTRKIKCKSLKSAKDCFRCGREGHYSSNCYASRHMKGYYL